jgi:hypothetical protein
MLAAFNTNAAASIGVIGWAMVDYIKYGRKFSVVGAFPVQLQALLELSLLQDMLDSGLQPSLASLQRSCALSPSEPKWVTSH